MDGVVEGNGVLPQTRDQVSPRPYACCEYKECRTEPRDRIDAIDQPKNSAKESRASEGRDHGDEKIREFMLLKFCFCQSHLAFDRGLFLAFWQVQRAKRRVGSPLSRSMVKFPGDFERIINLAETSKSRCNTPWTS